jgi:hypothetical protein
MRVEGGGLQTHRLNDTITAAQTNRFATDMGDFARRLTEYGDWGNPCMTAHGTQLWPHHLVVCARYRAVQARMDAERAERERKAREIVVDLTVLTPEPCVGCGDAA